MGSARSAVVSSFTVIKGALIEATYEAFRHWDLHASHKANVAQVRHTDLLGASSANWRRDLAKVLSRRFDTDGRDRPLVELAQAGCPLDVWKPILLWHMTRDEFLVRDFLVRWLYPLRAASTWRVRTGDVLPYLAELHTRPDLAIKDAWSPQTTSRVASGLLRMATDFGLMVGTQVREFVAYHVPDEALVYLVRAMAATEPNAHRLVHSEDWQMYLLSPDDVERELFRLHQLGQVHYEVAGRTAALRFPAEVAL